MPLSRRQFLKGVAASVPTIATVGYVHGCSRSIELGTQPILPDFFQSREDSIVAWLGMAGLIVNARGAIILIDPLITLEEKDGAALCEGHYRLVRPLPILSNDLPKVDLVAYTHADGDHFGSVTARKLINTTSCRFLATPPVADRLLDMELPNQRLLAARYGEYIVVGEAIVQVTPAKHDWQEENPWQRGDCCGYVIRTPGGSVWHPGDTELVDELLEISNVDVLLFDVAAVPSHLGPEGSARLAKSSGARVLVAYHYGTFDLPPGSYGNCDPLDALPYVKDLEAEYRIVDPGEVIGLPV